MREGDILWEPGGVLERVRKLESLYAAFATLEAGSSTGGGQAPPAAPSGLAITDQTVVQDHLGQTLIAVTVTWSGSAALWEVAWGEAVQVPTLSGLYELQWQETAFLPVRAAWVEEGALWLFSRVAYSGERRHEIALYRYDGSALTEVASVYGRTGDVVTGVSAAPTTDGWWVGMSYGGGSHYLVKYGDGAFGTPVQVGVVRPGLGGLCCDGDTVHTQYVSTYRYHLTKHADDSFSRYYFGSGPSITWATDLWLMDGLPVGLWADGQAHARRLEGGSISTEFSQNYRWKGNGALDPVTGRLTMAYRGTSDYNYHRYSYIRDRNPDKSWTGETQILDASALGLDHVNFAAPSYDQDGNLHVLMGLTQETTSTESEVMYRRVRDSEGAWADPELVWQASDDERIADLPWALYPVPEAGLGWIVPVHHASSGDYYVGLWADGLQLGYTVSRWVSKIVGGDLDA